MVSSRWHSYEEVAKCLMNLYKQFEPEHVKMDCGCHAKEGTTHQPLHLLFPETLILLVLVVVSQLLFAIQ